MKAKSKQSKPSATIPMSAQVKLLLLAADFLRSLSREPDMPARLATDLITNAYVLEEKAAKLRLKQSLAQRLEAN